MRARRWLALFQLGVAFGLAACAGASASRPAPNVRGAFFARSVSDLQRVSRWYCENLGFRVLRQNLGAEPKRALLARDGGLLELLEFSTARSRATLGLAEDGRDARGILKIGFEVADLDAAFAGARARGVAIYFPVVRPPGSELRTFGMLDPDRNVVQLFGR